MNKKKIALLVLAALAVCTLATIPMGEDDAVVTGSGTQESPFIINTADDMVKMGAMYGQDMWDGSTYYFKLGADIDLSDVNWTASSTDRYIFKCLRGGFDGNGHTISADTDPGLFCYVFYYTAGTTSISNLHMDTSGSPVSVVMETNGTKTTLENITIDDWTDQCANNDTPFIIFPAADETLFKNCLNNASWNINGYSGIFMAYPLGGGNIDVKFENCVNKGTITGDDVAFFVGNPTTKHANATYTVTNCKNEGSLTGSATADAFSTYGGSTSLSSYNTQALYDMLNGTGASITGTIEKHELSSSCLTVTVGDDKMITVSSGTGIPQTATSYSLQLEGSSSFFSDSTYGTHRIFINSGIKTLGTASSLKALPFVDLQRAVASYGVSTDIRMTTGSGFQYAEADTCYAVSSNYGQTSINTMPKAYVTLYDTNGNNLGRCQITITAAETHTSQKLVWCQSPAFSVTTNAVVSTDGSFTFNVTKSNGYQGDITVTAYQGRTDDKTVTVTATENGYSITGATTDVRIVVSGLTRSEFKVTYDLSNVTSTNTSTTIAAGETFTTTLSYPTDYTLDPIYVSMGGVRQTVSGTDVSISNVSGDIFIHAYANGEGQSTTSETTIESIVIGDTEATKTETVVSDSNGNVITQTTEIESENAYTVSSTQGDSTYVTSVVPSGSDVNAGITEAVAHIQSIATGSEQSIGVVVSSTSSDKVSVTISAGSVGLLSNANASIAVTGSDGSVIQLDSNTVSGMTGGLTISMGEANPLDMTASQINAMGEGIAISIDASVGGSSVHQLGGTATVAVPYDGDMDDVAVYYVADDGTMELMESVAGEGFVVFSTTHFSIYTIGPAPLIDDDEEEEESQIGGSGTTTPSAPKGEDKGTDYTTVVAAAVLVVIIAACAMVLTRKN